jgi:predicted TPR repeat methyltransferase
VFSVEVADGDGFVLQPNLRYAHAEPYLRSLAAAHGFDVHAVHDTTLREEQRMPVRGRVWCLGLA